MHKSTRARARAHTHTHTHTHTHSHTILLPGEADRTTSDSDCIFNTLCHLVGRLLVRNWLNASKRDARDFHYWLQVHR